MDRDRTYETKGKISTKTDVSEDRPHLVHLYERYNSMRMDERVFLY